MSGFTKLFSSIVHSTIWREDMHVKIVWITMLALSDQDGFVAASVPGLADAARVTVEQCEDAIGRFLSPDPYSRTKDKEGRRITEADGGWVLVNYDKHRHMDSVDARREKVRERVRRFRERIAAKESGKNVTPDVTLGNARNPKQKQKQKKKQRQDLKECSEPATTSPSEPEASAAGPDLSFSRSGEPGALTFPCVGIPKQWVLTKEQVRDWSDLFPHLDVESECRQALAWTLANAPKRKTAKGMPKFLVGWLGRAQDRGPRRNGAGRNSGLKTWAEENGAGLELIGKEKS